MSEVWFPGAVRKPGVFAGYVHGRTTMQAAKLHFTAGVDSTRIGLAGYFQWLLPKVGPPIQFAEADALCWDSGQGNGYGPGIEFERLSDEEPLTPDQLAWGGKLIAWLRAEWAIPLVFVDTPGAATFPLLGFVTHRSLPPPNDHVDYVTQADWDAMVNPAQSEHSLDIPPIPMEELMSNNLAVCDAGGGAVHLFVVGTDGAVYYKKVGADQSMVPAGEAFIKVGGAVRA